MTSNIGKNVTIHYVNSAQDSQMVEGILQGVTEGYIHVGIMSGRKVCSDAYINRSSTVLTMVEVWKEPKE